MSEPAYQILILDDDKTLSQMMADFLSISGQSQVHLTHQEVDFWAKYPEKPYDLIFLDYRLPTTTGLEVLEKLSNQGNKIPVVMMTGEGTEEIAVKAMQLGAFDYLVKGHFAVSILPSLVLKAVRMRQMQQEMQLSLQKIQYQATLLNNMRDAVVVWDIEGKINYWNKSAQQLFGFSSEERIGTLVQDNYLSTFLPPIAIDQLALISSTETERQTVGKDGKTIWISSQITPLYDENNPDIPTGYMDVARDITTRKLEQQMLNETRHFLEKIITSSPDLIYVYNIHSKALSFINPQFEFLLGFKPDEWKSKKERILIEHIHPDDMKILDGFIESAKDNENGTSHALELRLKDSRGNWHWFSSHESTFSWDENGLPIEIIGIAQDISTKKAMETQIQQRLVMEKLLSSISNFFININPENTDEGVEKSLLLIGNYIRPDFGAIYLMDTANHLNYYCGFEKAIPESTRILQKAETIDLKNYPWLLNRLHKRQSLQISNLDELPTDANNEKKFLTAMKVKAITMVPMIYNNELLGVLTMFMTNREYKWVSDQLHMLHSFADMVVNAVVQKRSEEALRKSEERYRAIVEDHQTELICRTDPDFQLTFVNETFCEYYQRTREELVGLNCKTLIHAEDHNLVETALTSCTKEKPITHFECRVNVDSKVRWQEWTVRAIYNDSDVLIDFQGVGRDITERKLMEAQLVTAQTLLTQNSRMAAIGELASSVAHQISNPLTTIIAEAQILSNSIPKEHIDFESTTSIISAGWRAQHVIQELLKFSEKPKNSKELIAINETIEKAVLLAGPHLQTNRSTNLTVTLADGLPDIRGNLQQLEDLWVTLLLLAREATTDDNPHNVRIISSAIENENSVLIEISDDGNPLQEDQLDTIFEPQLIPTGLGRGTGIELSICREIVRQHSGSISVKIIEGNTIFSIILPGSK